MPLNQLPTHIVTATVCVMVLSWAGSDCYNRSQGPQSTNTVCYKSVSIAHYTADSIWRSNRKVTRATTSSRILAAYQRHWWPTRSSIITVDLYSAVFVRNLEQWIQATDQEAAWPHLHVAKSGRQHYHGIPRSVICNSGTVVSILSWHLQLATVIRSNSLHITYKIQQMWHIVLHLTKQQD